MHQRRFKDASEKTWKDSKVLFFFIYYNEQVLLALGNLRYLNRLFFNVYAHAHLRREKWQTFAR